MKTGLNLPLALLAAVLAAATPGCSAPVLQAGSTRVRTLPGGGRVATSPMLSTYFEVRGRDVLLVDGGFREATEDVLRLLAGKRIRFLIITHENRDHVGVLERLDRLPGLPRVLMTSATARRLAAKGLPIARLRQAGRLTLVDARTAFAGHGFRFELIPAPAAHTDGDLFVWLPGSRVVVAGDLFLGGHYPLVWPLLGGTYVGLRRALAAIRATGAVEVVPGHGERSILADVERTATFLDWAERGVRQARAEGLDRAATVARLRAPPVVLRPLHGGMATLDKVVGGLWDELASVGPAPRPTGTAGEPLEWVAGRLTTVVDGVAWVLDPVSMAWRRASDGQRLALPVRRLRLPAPLGADGPGHRKDLPVSSHGRLVAWAEGRGLCLGNVGSTGVRCVPWPPRVPMETARAMAERQARSAAARRDAEALLSKARAFVAARKQVFWSGPPDADHRRCDAYAVRADEDGFSLERTFRRGAVQVTVGHGLGLRVRDSPGGLAGPAGLPRLFGEVSGPTQTERQPGRPARSTSASGMTLIPITAVAGDGIPDLGLFTTAAACRAGLRP